MFYFEPIHMILTLIGLPLIFLPQWWVKKTYETYAAQANRSSQTGAEVARAILDRAGLTHVRVEESQGFLSDHYSPMEKVVRLSPYNYSRASVAGAAIAAHECGHALQHAAGFFPVVIRSAIAPVVGFASGIGPWLIILGIWLGAAQQLAPQYAWYIAWAGVWCYGAAVAFHMVTLPVEFDASGRALKVLEGHHYLSDNEMAGARKVLAAAALTYVSTALYALMELLYWIWRLTGASRRD